MHARLSVTRGSKTQQVDLRLPTIIGRGAAAKLKLPSAIVSRQHCEVYAYDGQIAIRDLGSSNGTVVNGHRIDVPTFLTQDDEVSLGPVSFRLAVLDDNAVAQPSTESSPPSSVDDANALAELSSIPAATETPQCPHTTAATESNADHDQCSADGEESVLKYVEPQGVDDRSFVGIETGDEQAAEPESESPSLASDSESPVNVDADDSSLRSFFTNLDNE